MEEKVGIPAGVEAIDLDAAFNMALDNLRGILGLATCCMDSANTPLQCQHLQQLEDRVNFIRRSPPQRVGPAR